jgi:hypothetical protein
MLFNAAGCESGSSIPTAGAPAGPLPPEYRVLAESLAFAMAPTTDEFRENKDVSAVLAESYAALLSFRGIDSADVDIQYIAKEAEASCADALARFERLNTLPKPESFVSVFATSFIHGLVGNADAGYAAGVEADAKQEKLANELRGLLAATDKARALQLMLPKVAQKYAATPSKSSGRLMIDIDEPWGWDGPFTWCGIYNAGPKLEDCTIQVHLVGAGNESRKNVHFVRHWPAKSWMYSRYEPGRQILDRADAGNTTVKGIRRAEISLWSPTFTTTLPYTYEGSERDNDAAKRCEQLTFVGRFQPHQGGRLWNTRMGVEFTLDGVAFIPECEVRVTYRSGSKSVTPPWTWEIGKWTKGQKRHFDTADGDVGFEPEQIDMTITFPGIGYAHQYSCAVN